MEESNKITQLESLLIQLVAKGKGNWGWYELANALSRRDVPREPDMMTVLKKLDADGLLKRYVQPGSPRDRWELTAAGMIIWQLIDELEYLQKRVQELEKKQSTPA